MPLIPLDIPPGVYANGTDYQGSGRWRDANLVRWHEGALRPVKGWRQRGDVDIDGVVRTMKSWGDESGNRRVAFGTHDKLFAMTSGNTVSDITPTGFTAGNVDAQINVGFGAGSYSVEEYGLPRSDTGNISFATTWALDNWGEYLVGCTADDGKLYEWQLDSATPAQQLTNSPVDCTSLLVTEERFIFALGAGGDPRAIAWCDREDNTTWTPAATNEAGDIRLQTDGEIVAGVRTRGQSLILTTQDAHVASYQGPPFVYGFERVGTSCGLAAANALVSIDAGAFWMGRRSFFVYSGGAVQELPCEVSDYVFSDMNFIQQSKVHAVVNSRWSEIWWFYPSSASTECDSYVVYDYAQNVWTFGRLTRTAGIDSVVFRSPLWIAPDGVLYEHEVGFNHHGETVFAETGPISIGSGDNIMSVNRLIPDEKNLGDVSATFKTRFYPTAEERTYGPYTMSNPTSVRFSGRQVRMRVEGVENVGWRVGTMRINANARGLR